jgi:predicted RNase H-like nuclease (RuvC/YqgF family)
MGDTSDERVGDEHSYEERGKATEADIVIPIPAGDLPDQNTQILQTWASTRELPEKVDALQRQVQQLEQQVQQLQQQLQEDVRGLADKVTLHGRPVSVMVGMVLVHMGIDPVTGLPKD